MSKFEDKIKEDLGWLMVLCPTLPPKSETEHIEPAAQALSILQSLNMFKILNREPLTSQEMLKLAVAGWIAMKARKVDEQRFHQVLPQSFIHLANFLVDANDNGDNYQKLIQKISA